MHWREPQWAQWLRLHQEGGVCRAPQRCRSQRSRRCVTWIQTRPRRTFPQIQSPQHRTRGKEDKTPGPQARQVSESTVVPTVPKKHCTDDAGKQTERTALVPVPDPSVAMAPVMQLSTQANTNVAAIHGALAQGLDGMQGRMGLMGSGRTLKIEVTLLESTDCSSLSSNETRGPTTEEDRNW